MWHSSAFVSALQKDAVDDGADDLVEAPQVRADNRAGDDDDHDALERLAAARPVDLPELGGRLADELPALTVGLSTGLLLDGLLGRSDLRCTATSRGSGSVAVSGSRRTPLSSSLASQLPGLPVRGVLAAPPAVLLELDPIRGVPLRLLGLVVTPLALGACERDRDSDSGGHCSFRFFVWDEKRGVRVAAAGLEPATRGL